MRQSTAIRLMIADDHPIVRAGLTAIIESRPDMQIVAEAGSGVEALERFRQHRPDVTLMDLRLPELDGIEAIGTICNEFPRARIIILTALDNEECVYRGLRAGAKAFLLKATPCERILEVIREVHAGQSHIPPEMAIKLAARMNARELTPREQEVLERLTAGKSNQEIAAELSVTESTIKSHVNGILSKLRVSDRTQAVTTAVKRGLVTLR